jgi:hypothetical protein
MSSAKALARWQLALWRRRLGRPGLAGVALLALALLFYAAVVIPEHLEANDLEERTTAMAAAARSGDVPAGLAPQARLAAFYQAFPGRDAATEWLERIYAAGEQAGLVLDKGEYRLAPERDARLVRYEVNLPVRGNYVQIRRFVRSVLADIPFAALNDFQIRRGTVSEGEVEARLRFNLYFREEA